MKWPWETDTEIRSLWKEVVDLRHRVRDLEDHEWRAQHVHSWRYGKHVFGNPESFGGRATAWTWECLDERCNVGHNSTNTSSHLPDHFPGELR